jgi:hypothetical protein
MRRSRIGELALVRGGGHVVERLRPFVTVAASRA